MAGEGLHGTLVARVYVGPLITVDFDADEVAVQDLRHARVFVRLAVHHVAPMTPHRADVEQDRLVFGARPRKDRIAPGEPMDGLMGGGLEIR